jgi:trehalose/maltose hydrolase-like predicted phosphorylase
MDRFSITYSDWKPEEQKLREALCTLGNGYFASRGAAEESKNDEFNYPGTYLAGGYNRAKTEIAGRTIENEDLVNFPNWLCLNFRADGGQWMNLRDFKLLDYKQSLLMRNGILLRELKIEDEQGRRFFIRSRRLVSMKDKHVAGIEWSISSENWEGSIEVRSALDGNVKNDNVSRYRQLESNHLKLIETKQIDDDSVLLTMQTSQSRLIMAQAARTRLYRKGEKIDASVDTIQDNAYIGQNLRFDIRMGESYSIEKTVVVYTSRDNAISEPSIEAEVNIHRAPRFEEILRRHELSWDRLWQRADMGIINGDYIQQLLRLHIFHIIQSVSFNSIGIDVGVPSRGWHGEAYRGHIFWDELYIFPFLNLRFPEITRSLLMYRYNRLEEARHIAKEEGFKGAVFPWQSGSNGREETQVLHLNPKSGRWNPDNTHLQRHVNSAIAYNVWKYYLATDDQDFLSYYGSEIFISIAAFWAQKAFYNPKRDRFEIHQVVGPDEYHTAYPDSDIKGLKNNAYTNIMAAWILHKALEILSLIKKDRKRELLKELEIDDNECALWKDISEKMFIPFIHDDIIEQFEGYKDLKEFPWEEYQKKYGDIHRLDRILEKENDSPNNYKASKQADVLMLFFLFSYDELNTLFKRLGYPFSEEMIRKNIEYYRKRTSHGSTLSRTVFSKILSKFDKQKSWKNFEQLIISDFEDIQGGTTPEGIHLGAMAGSIDLIQRVYAGLEVGEEALWINPDLPEHFEQITMKIKYKRHWLWISVDHQNLKIAFEEGWGNKVNIGVIDKMYEFKKGEIRNFSLKSKTMA